MARVVQPVRVRDWVYNDNARGYTVQVGERAMGWVAEVSLFIYGRKPVKLTVHVPGEFKDLRNVLRQLGRSLGAVGKALASINLEEPR